MIFVPSGFMWAVFSSFSLSLGGLDSFLMKKNFDVFMPSLNSGAEGFMENSK